MPKELVFNLDQFGLKILAVTDRTRVPVGQKSVPIVGSDDERQITGVPVVSAADTDNFVGVQLIWTGTTDRCHPKDVKKDDKLFHTHSSNHWSTPESMLDLIDRVLVPHIEVVIKVHKLSPLQKAILVLDVWKHHLSLPFNNYLKSLENQILVLYPPNCTGKAQGPSLSLLKVITKFAISSSTRSARSWPTR